MRPTSMKKYFFILLLIGFPTMEVAASDYGYANRKLTNQIFTQGEIIDKYTNQAFERRYTIIFKKKVYNCMVGNSSMYFECWSDKRF